jgi:RHS repeat-associated protein
MKSAKLWALLGVLLAGSVPVLAQTNVNEERGLKPYDSFQGGDLDSISMTNGGLVLHIPLVSFPQRGSLDLSFSVYANAKQWYLRVNPVECANQFDPNGCTPVWVPIRRGMQPQFGGVPVEGAYVTSSLDWLPDNECNVDPGNPDNGFTATYNWSASISAPDGNAHQFGSGSSTSFCPTPPYRALDATGIFQPDANNIVMPDGTRFDFSSSNGLIVTDANGNRITTNNTSWTYTDTLGRVVPLPPLATTTDVSTCPAGTASAKVWGVPGLSGGTRTFKLCYSNISIYTNFGQGGIEYGPLNNLLLTAIVEPDLTMWTFSYDHYGDITRMGFPTGGSISYTYAIGPQTCGADTPISLSVTSRTVDANDGTGGHTWSYAYAGHYTPGSGSYSGTTTVTSPDGNDTVHTITTPVTGAGCSFYDTQVQYYQGNHVGGTLLKTAATQYSGIANPLGSPGSMTAANVVSAQTTVTTRDGHTGRTVKTWDSGNTFAPYGTAVPVVFGSLLQHDEYDFANTLVRSTVNHYLWQDNATYKSRNFISLPVSAILKDGAGCEVAKTSHGYDETYNSITLQSSLITTQHVAAPWPVRGNRTSSSSWLISACAEQSAITSHTIPYDTGLPYQSYDPLGHFTQYTYSSSFAGAYLTQTNLPDTQMPDTGAPVVHHVISGNYDFNTGLLTSFTDENSQQFTYTYDSLMLRLTQGNHPDGGITKFLYPDPNTVERQRLITGTTYDDYKVKFDGVGRPYQTQQLTPDCATYIKVDTTYDAVGRAKTASNPYCLTSEPTYGITQSDYDALSRTTKTTKQDGSFTTVNYEDTPADTSGPPTVCTTVTDEAGKKRQACSDAFGRLLKVVEPNPATGSLTTSPLITTYQYNTRGEMLCVHQKATDTTADVACTGTMPPTVPAAWRQRFFTYDSFSRLLTAMNPELNSTGSTVITYGYDNDSRLTSKIEPAPNAAWGSSSTVTVNYTYDALNRLLDTTFTDGTTLKASHRYDYASFQGQSFTNPIGREVAALTVNSSGSTVASTFASYDVMGRVANTVQCNPSVSGCKTFTAGYDKLGDLTTLAYPGNGFTVTYGYDSAARLTTATDSNGVIYAQTPTYLASGAIQEFTSPNFANNKYHVSYNNRLQPIEIWTGSAQGSPALFDKQYSYGTAGANNGNIYTITNVKDSTRTQGFTYDPLNRLLTAGDNGHWANTYTYDAWGNLSNKTPGSPAGESMNQPADTNNHLSGLTYDSAGNVINDGLGGTFVFDGENRIKTAGSVTYTYDAYGRRVQKSTGINYWYGPSSQVFAETDSAGNWTNYIFFGGQRLARNVPQPSPNPPDIKYYITDHLHSTGMFVDQHGSSYATDVKDDNDFYPWGGVVPGVGKTTSTNTIKFTGQYRDTDTAANLDYFDARYYANTIGRFMSPDWAGAPTTVPYAKFGDPQSLNLYSYTENGPINRLDPTGHCFQCIPGENGGAPTGPTQRQLDDAARDTTPGVTGGGTGCNGHPCVLAPPNSVQVPSSTPSIESSSPGVHREAEEARKVLANFDLIYKGQTMGEFLSGATDQQVLDAQRELVMQLSEKYNWWNWLNKSAGLASAGVILPAGISNSEFGQNVMKWGRGDAQARERISTLTREELEKGGVTKEIAKSWRDFYQQVKASNPTNPSAQGRMELMQKAFELLGGK